MSRGSPVATVIIVLVVLLIGLPLLWGGLMMGGMMGPGMMGYGFAYSPLRAVVSLAFWGLIIVGGALLLIWLVRQAGVSDQGPVPHERRALEILKERYARGEITREQFEQMRHDLE